MMDCVVNKSQSNLPVANNYEFLYYATVCHVCKKTSDLKRCSNCKLVSYCSLEHQQYHYDGHRNFCDAARFILTLQRIPHIYHGIKSIDALIDIKQSYIRFFPILMHRPLTFEENQILFFPRYCAVCFNFKQDELVDCEKCLSVSYCSPEHKQQHESTHCWQCCHLQLALQSELFKIQEHPENNAFQIISIPESCAVLPCSTDDFLNKFLLEYPHMRSDLIKKMYAQEVFSYSLTIMYTLEKLKLSQSRQFKSNKFVIHIIGAGNTEVHLNWTIIVETLLHWMLNVTEMIIVCVGPEINKNESVSITDFLCKTCRDQNRSVRLIFISELYHNFVKSDRYSEFHTKPDLNVVFNCGFHEFENTPNDTWSHSLSLILNESIPLVFTSYTQDEAIRDMNMVTGMAMCSAVINCEKNPYKSPRPIRCWIGKESPVFYHNHYISAIYPIHIENLSLGQRTQTD